MAIFDSALFGKLKKRIDNITTYEMGGMNIVRKIPTHVRNPKTEKQRWHRARVKTMGDYSSLFSPAHTIGFPERELKQTTYSSFYKENFELVAQKCPYPCPMLIEKIACSRGSLATPAVTANVNSGNKSVTFGLHDQSLVASANASDLIYAFIFEEKMKDSELYKLNRRDCTGDVILSLYEDWNPARVHIYVFATSENGKKASNTIFLS